MCENRYIETGILEDPLSTDICLKGDFQVINSLQGQTGDSGDKGEIG